MPDIGRWGNLDALSEKYYPVSPYNYALNNPMFFVDPDGNYIEIYYQAGGKGRNVTYSYKEGRNYEKLEGGSEGFLADAYRALDALYQASNIILEDGTSMNVMQTLMDDKRELSVVETNSGSHFAQGRDYKSFNKKTNQYKQSFDVLGTIHFNRSEGVAFNDKKDIKPENAQSEFFNTNGTLKRTTLVNSPTSILGHELTHSFNYLTALNTKTLKQWNESRVSRSVIFYGITFKSLEEAKTTTLSSQININLGENPRCSHVGSGIQTQGVLSNIPKR
jgi:hypothetical protein